MEFDKYRLVNYFDVWRTEDGWDVNNMSYEDGEIILAADVTDAELVDALVKFGFFKHTVTVEDVTIWNDYEMIEFYDIRTDEPLCRLELIRE